jgi:23S rRNA pseudouridine1911/1915/1917 synthase
MTEHHIYFVDAAHEGSRLDRFLTIHLRAHSRSRIKMLIDAGHVTVNGIAAKPALRLRRGQRVEVVIPPLPPGDVGPEDIPLDVVHEDEHLLVINKPPGLTVHPGAGRPSGTLVNAILARVPSLAGVGSRQRPGIVHRLDKDTSGLLVVAKTPLAYRSLQAQVAARTVRRAYLALVYGSVPHDAGTIEAPIARHPRHRTRMAVMPRGRAAITRYQVVERFAHHTLVEAQLVTGRTHQIRVHFAHLGHPVVGDPVYSGRPDDLGVGRQALHAYQLTFEHPATGIQIALTAPPPADFTAAVGRARTQGQAQDRRMGRHR